LKRELEWFYGYHERSLQEEFLGGVGYFLNEMVYRARQKSPIIQKVLIIVLAFILISLLTGHSFVTVTLTLVGGIFYLRL